MQIIADLQVHSKYSRAVSPKMDLTEISGWASKKGINLMATGDWTHPLWFRAICTDLTEVGNGIYTLKKRPEDQKNDVYFLLSTEISSIYSHKGNVRRVHNLIFSPSIATSEKIIRALEKRGANLISDGRPIVGIPSHELLQMVLTIDPTVIFIPAHAWTPWFSIFGSKSGYDSIAECFGDLEKHIFAIETGLSSDPIMNWQIKELDNRSIVSFSDAHSGPKLGREATVFIPHSPHIPYHPSDLTYQDVADAISQNPKGKLKIGYTIEFFPEEGKYHWSGHRACNIKYDPATVKEKGKICPVCHQPLTIGVENRVLDLSHKLLEKKDLLFLKNSVGLTFVYDREKKRKPFVSVIPLLEVLLEINKGSHTKAASQYENLVSTLGSEFDILLRKPYQDIQTHAGTLLRNAIEIIRDRRVYVDPGYDGVFGIVKIFQNENADQKTEKPKEKQQSLF